MAMVIREARSSDLDQLCAIRYGESPAMHHDRLAWTGRADFHYLVVELDGRVVGFGVLALEVPESWPAAEQDKDYPQAIDLYVSPGSRGRGGGTALLTRMEEIAREWGADRLCLTVDPLSNKRALQLYKRLGYETVTAEPYRDHWSFRTSDGELHQGDEWAIDLAKPLHAYGPDPDSQ